MPSLKQIDERQSITKQLLSGTCVSERPRLYLRIPDRLLRQFVHDPLAVGVYLAVARCALAERGPAPLSANDLAAWSGNHHSRAAIMRRIQQLIATGWLLARREQTVKLRLLPTWGNHGWQFNDLRLGKPADVHTRRVPLDLLDSYLGRCDAQPGRRPALITRYFDQPLLDLVDIGTYAIATIAEIMPTERLWQFGLLRDGEPHVPQNLDDLLTTVADGHVRCGEQGVQATIRLSTFGWRKLRRSSDGDLSDDERDCQSRSASESPSGSPSGSRSGSPSRSASGSRKLASGTIVYSLPERPKARVRETRASYAWDSWNSSTEGMNPPPGDRGSGGGSSLVQHYQQKPATTAVVSPEAEAMLRAMGVRNLAALADIPVALIAQWQAVVSHPGMQARFSDPVGFAITQMKQHIAPPLPDELERWSAHAQRKEMSQSWRHIAPVEAPPDNERHALLAERARAIAPPGTSGQALLELFTLLTEGVGETEALERLARWKVVDDSQHSNEEVYRALIARSARR